jgi:PAS domain S-box-containing protein
MPMPSPPNLTEILAKINDGVCVLSKEGEVSFVNEKASEIVETADLEFQIKLAAAVKDQGALRFEHFHSKLNRWFEHQTYGNADGGLTLISRDTTSRHRVEEALRANEERFQRLIESNIIGVIVVEDGCIAEANDLFLNMLGRSRSDLIAKQLRWREMTPSEHDLADSRARIELESSGVFSSYEKEFLHQDGSRVPVLISGVAVEPEKNGRETLCLVLNLSRRRRAEERLRAIIECGKTLASSLECDRTFLEMAEFVVSNLADSCIIFVKEEDKFVRMADVHALPLTAGVDLEAGMNQVMMTGETLLMHTPVSRVIAPIIAHDKISGVFAVSSAKLSAFEPEDRRLFQVLAGRAGLALESARLYHETQRANRLKDEFVAIVSHELRTPLTPILGGVYMLRTEPHDEKVFERALNLIERNAKTQVKIVDDLLDVSRALSGKLRLNMEPVDLVQVIQAAVETVRPASEAKRIRIDVQLEVAAAVVAGDADRLQQVLWNLLANSVKFTPDGGCIILALREVQTHAEIRVTDTGIGIDPEFLPHVFDRFRQADTSRTRVHGGLGLGLAIVRHLVESHGGTINAQSTGNEQGATFVVRLPLRAMGRTAAPKA